MKNKISVYSLILFGLLFYITISCKKPNELPSIITREVTDITTTTAISGGYLIGDTSHVTMCGICWHTSPDPTFSNNKFTLFHFKDSFILRMSELLHSTTYYVRAYAIIGNDTIYGNEIRFRTADTFVGDNFEGGTVAYIFKSGDPGYIEGEIHGLVISPYDLMTLDKYAPYPITEFIPWDEEKTMVQTGATGQAIGTGNSNTNAIVSSLGLGRYAHIPRFYAAKLCYDLNVNGYSDWYLPSIEELEKILVNRSLLNIRTTYWSSTEVSNSTALILTFYETGTRYEMDKGYFNFVRAVRTF